MNEIGISEERVTQLAWSRTEDRHEWDDFVMQNQGSVYHSWAWRMVLEGEGREPSYMACRDGRGTLIAICPFFYVKRRRGMYILSSLPSGHLTGPLIGTEVANIGEVLQSLRRSVKFSLLDPIVFMYLRVHQKPIARTLIDWGFNPGISGLFILDLFKKTPVYIWEQVFRNQERRDIRYYEKGDSSLEFAHQENDYERFLAMQQESMSRQGYRPLTRQLLSSLRLNLGEMFRVASVTSRSQAIAALGLICDTHSSMIHTVYAGYSRAENSKSSLFFAEWKLINWASENGFRHFDLGPTSADPADPRHRAKRKFGGEWVERYSFHMPVESRFALPVYLKSRSLVRSIVRAVSGS